MFRLTGTAQGTTYSIIYLGDDSILSRYEVDSIFNAIDLSLSLYKEHSLINRFNRDGKVIMDHHLKAVINRSMEIWKSSGGSFDITVKNLVDLWGFGVKGKGTMPSQKQIDETKLSTGSQFLVVDRDSLRALKKNIRIDCNGIAQGYSVDVIFQYLESKGIEDFMVELGGEVRTRGRKINGESWHIGVESPSGITEDWYAVEDVIELSGKAVTTSGNYRKYFTQGGKMYSHVIDPVRGRPVDNGIVSVTVVADDAITADGWDNAFYVMGIDASFAYLSKHPEMEIKIVYEDKNGAIKDTCTAGFKKLRVR